MLLPKSILKSNETIDISGSKSISNRLLILRQLHENIIIENLSDSQDTDILLRALVSDSEEIDIHHAGTAMRFLTAYFAMQEDRQVILTGSPRMKNRPIKELVDALISLGAEIDYLDKEGYPPLKIKGKKITKSSVTIPANISSQFITALMLIGTKLENGIRIKLTGKITSISYLKMTLKILKNLGINAHFKHNIITIESDIQTEKKSQIVRFVVESDWSSASYFYSFAAISRENINLTSFRTYSLQGDSVLKELYWNCFGVNTISGYEGHQISLMPEQFVFPESISLNLNSAPDIAQTICVTAAALKIPFKITGLETLKIKETDRLIALKNELYKIGCNTEITEDSISSTGFFNPLEDIIINTYSDHRMAMSFAPFCLIKELQIDDENVVEKSYPNFWNDVAKILKQ